MEFANESQWRTDDLWNLVEGVRAMPGFRQGYRIYNSTLLLIRTGNPQPKKYQDREDFSPPAATYDYDEDRWSDTQVVKIRSADKLTLEVLDRLAHIGDDYQQDMHEDDVVVVAKAIYEAISRDSGYGEDFSWAKSKSLRFRKKIERSSLAAEREIDALLYKRRRIIRRANKSVEKIDEKVEELKKIL